MIMDAGLKAVVRAADFAAIKHRNQKRKDPQETPYINHPIGVAKILTEEGGVNDPIIIQAALLHDTVEDTDTTLDEIEENFGPSVRNIVAEVTDNKSLPYLKRKEMQIEKAPLCSHEAKLVKLADKLYNLRDLQKCTPKGWNVERVDQYFVWASKVIHGLKGTNKNLEDALKSILATRDIILDEMC